MKASRPPPSVAPIIFDHNASKLKCDGRLLIKIIRIINAPTTREIENINLTKGTLLNNVSIRENKIDTSPEIKTKEIGNITKIGTIFKK